jgi:prephenate dehydratase
LKELGVETKEAHDTAGSARIVSEKGDISIAAIAPALSAEIYNLEILKENIEDTTDNATRCIALAKELIVPPADTPSITTFIFEVKNIPSALYKAIGCFATNGLNLTKLESYQLNGSFLSTQFYVDVEGSVEDEKLQHALKELEYYASHIQILGSYPRDTSRRLTSV